MQLIIDKKVYILRSRWIEIYTLGECTEPEEIWKCPSFQLGDMTHIRETDGGLMVGFSTGAIYYVNPFGEYYHLRTVPPPEENAIMTHVDPPNTTWLCWGNRWITVNSDNIIDYH